jgi:hypothetical protein
MGRLGEDGLIGARGPLGLTMVDLSIVLVGLVKVIGDYWDDKDDWADCLLWSPRP